MKSFRKQSRFSFLPVVLSLLSAPLGLAQGNDAFVGVWTVDEGFQIVEFLFRSDGRYQLDTRSTDPGLDFSSTDGGRYEVSGETLTLKPYDYFGEPQEKGYTFQISESGLTLTTVEFPKTQVYQFKAGSRADVLAREKVDKILVGTWSRTIAFAGKAEYTFRPDGRYFLKNSQEDSQFPSEFIRGQYQQDGTRLTIRPYSGLDVQYEMDFFGDTLTLIKNDASFGESSRYQKIPGSGAEVAAKAADAQAFLSRQNWQVGVWEIRNEFQTIDLTIRPDGHYIAKEDTEFLAGIVRGRYTLESGQIHFFPFVGQGIYARSNGDFGKVERTRVLDYYDGELQFIDPEAISQSVTLARKRAGSEAAVLEKARQAELEREHDGWQIGVWEVNDPTGWMEFTFRPDHRYIAKSGTDGVPSHAERGRYAFADDKVTLAPYSGLGAPRGFELDLYDGELFLIGDLARMVIARKVPGSEAEVIEKTQNPEAMKGERGSILGLWTANMPGQFAQLVFRQDGQFRLSRCLNNSVSYDYGLYDVNMGTRALVYDSRFVEVQSRGLDFYGNTLTIYGGFEPPNTYTANLGTVDTAIADSFATDAQDAQVDAQWLARVPVGPRDPNAVQMPSADIPADPRPGSIFNAPTVFANFQFYRRLILGFAYFNEQGRILTVPVVNTSEWYFFPTGRVLVRFKNYRAGLSYPNTVADITENWGAYRVDPKPVQTDILHLYADNSLFIETDLGEQIELTLEDGRRNLFWKKDYQILSEWAAEQKPIPCQSRDGADGSLLNAGVSLTTNIEADDTADSPAIPIRLTGPVSGKVTIIGKTEAAGNLVAERTTSLVSPIVWESLLTNAVPAGPFSFQLPQGTNTAAYFQSAPGVDFSVTSSNVTLFRVVAG